MTASPRVRRPEEERLAARIRQTYLANLYGLPGRERIHLLRRVYRLTGDPEVADLIGAVTDEKTVQTVRRRSFELERLLRRGEPYPRVKFPASSNVRTRERNRLFAARPELYFYRRYTMALFQVQSAGLHETVFAAEWDGIIETMKKVDFDKMFVSEEIINTISSFAVNTVIFLHHLGVDTDLHRRFVGYLRGAYLDHDDTLVHELDDRDYTSFIYNLTHVIIAYSKYYQEWINQPRWIGEYFAGNVDEILARCTHDTIAEVGVSLKLLRMDHEYPQVQDRIIDHLLTTYDFDAALAPENLARTEHTNAVIMLLLENNETWHAGLPAHAMPAKPAPQA